MATAIVANLAETLTRQLSRVIPPLLTRKSTDPTTSTSTSITSPPSVPPSSPPIRASVVDEIKNSPPKTPITSTIPTPRRPPPAPRKPKRPSTNSTTSADLNTFAKLVRARSDDELDENQLVDIINGASDGDSGGGGGGTSDCVAVASTTTTTTTTTTPSTITITPSSSAAAVPVVVSRKKRRRYRLLKSLPPIRKRAKKSVNTTTTTTTSLNPKGLMGGWVRFMDPLKKECYVRWRDATEHENEWIPTEEVDVEKIQEYQQEKDWVIQYEDDNGVWKTMEDGVQQEIERDLQLWSSNETNFELGVTIRYTTRKSSVFNYTIRLGPNTTVWEQINNDTGRKRLIRRVPRSITTSNVV